MAEEDDDLVSLMTYGAWNAHTFSRRLSILANGFLLVALLIVAMIQLESVLKPFFIALGIYFILKPGADILSSGKFPVFLSYITMLLLFTLVITSTFFFAWLQTNALIDDDVKMENYNQQLNERWMDLKEWPLVESLFDSGMNNTTTSDNSNSSLSQDLSSLGLLQEGEAVTDLAVGLLSGVGAMFATSLTVFFFLVFIILEASFLRGRIERAWPGKAFDTINVVGAQIEESVNTYIIVKTGCGIGTAFIAGSIMWAFGIDLWFVWAILTFLLNYVPYIGSLIATIPPILFGFVTLGTAPLIVMTILLLVNQQVWGNVIETKWAGRALDLSPVLLLIVTAFSFWLWGIVGMILSVPFIVIIKIVLENIEATRPIAILLSERAPTLEEAWEEALKDGRLTLGENHKLRELQKLLDVSDDEVVFIAGRTAVNLMIKRRRASALEIGLAVDICLDVELRAELARVLTPGRLNDESRKLLKQLVAQLDEEE